MTTQYLDGGDLPISILVRDCEFVNNAKSPNGTLPNTEIALGATNYNNPVKGEIRFEQTSINGSKGRILFSRKLANAFKVVFKDFVAKNIITSGDYAL